MPLHGCVDEGEQERTLFAASLLLTLVCGLLRLGMHHRVLVQFCDDDIRLTEGGHVFAVVCATIALVGVLLISNPFAALGWACASTIGPLLVFIASLPPLHAPQPIDTFTHNYYARYVDRRP